MEEVEDMQNPRRILLSEDGNNQVLNIPREFSLSGTEVLLRKEGRCLVIEPISESASLLSLLSSWTEIPEEISDPDMGLLPLDEVIL